MQVKMASNNEPNLDPVAKKRTDMEPQSGPLQCSDRAQVDLVDPVRHAAIQYTIGGTVQPLQSQYQSVDKQPAVLNVHSSGGIDVSHNELDDGDDNGDYVKPLSNRDSVEELAEKYSKMSSSSDGEQPDSDSSDQRDHLRAAKKLARGYSLARQPPSTQQARRGLDKRV